MPKAKMSIEEFRAHVQEFHRKLKALPMEERKAFHTLPPVVQREVLNAPDKSRADMVKASVQARS